jgi:peroxiredoxin
MFVSSIYYSPAVEPFIRAVLANHPDRSDRARACHALATMLRMKVHFARHFRKYPAQIEEYKDIHGTEAIARFLRETDPDAVQKQTEAMLERVIKEYGDMRMSNSPRTLGEVAVGELNALRNLNIGQTAPDIEGADVEGKPLKLSDFRGKVVLLSFSGEWYPECRAIYARQRDLLKKYAGRPLAVVDVNTDTIPDRLRRSIKLGRVTWPCWWDGGITGPIATRWGITGYPNVFVLDARGVIRYRHVQGEGMDNAVDELMVEAKE